MKSGMIYSKNSSSTRVTLCKIQDCSYQLDISNAEAPWAKSLYSHASRLDVMNMRESLVVYLQRSLSDLGINEDHVLQNWGKDPLIQEEILTQLHRQILEIENHCVHDPIFGKMRDLLGKELENATNLYYQPPIAALSGTKSSTTRLSRAYTTNPMTQVIEEFQTVIPRRRAASEDKYLPPLPQQSTGQQRTRTSSGLSFDAIQNRIAKFTSQMRRGRENSVDSPATPQSPETPASPASSISYDIHLFTTQSKPRKKERFRIQKGL